MVLRGPAGMIHDLFVDPALSGRTSRPQAARRHGRRARRAGCASGRPFHGRPQRRGAAAVRKRRFPPDDDRDDAGYRLAWLALQARRPVINRCLT
ncbi:hypothetical protein AB5I41_25105 [Sphingomonas sp. MMS24-JH45]